MSITMFSSEELFTQLPDPAFLIEVGGNIVDANPLAMELFEVADSLVGVNVLDLITQPERARLNVLTWMEKWASTKHAPEIDYVYLTCRTQQGNEKQIGVRVSRLINDKTYYLVTLRDITVAEARLRAERFAHRVAARILAISADAIVTTDGSLKVTQINKSAEALFGYSAAEVLGQPIGMLMPKRYGKQHIRHMKKFAQEDNPSRLMGERSVVVGITSSGEEISLVASITRFSIDNYTIFSAHLRKISSKRNSNAEPCQR